MNAVWDGWVSAGNTPARATVEAKLAIAGLKVEIMVRRQSNSSLAKTKGPAIAGPFFRQEVRRRY